MNDDECVKAFRVAAQFKSDKRAVTQIWDSKHWAILSTRDGPRVIPVPRGYEQGPFPSDVKYHCQEGDCEWTAVKTYQTASATFTAPGKSSTSTTHGRKT